MLLVKYSYPYICSQVKQQNTTDMTKEAKIDVYQRVTDKIVAGLQRDGLKWFRPWATEGMEMPINNATEKPYKGVNTLLLSVACAERGFEFNEWLTYKQCADKGGNVKKGAKSEFVVFWSVSFKSPEGQWFPNEKAVLKAGINPNACQKNFSAKLFNVFNIAECENIEAIRPKVEIDTEKVVEPIERAEGIFTNYPNAVKPTLSHGGDQAYYRPSAHHVQMPEMNSFVTADYYYGTLFHELVHSTGAEQCLKRAAVTNMDTTFGSDKYAKEELVAEIGAQMLIALCGLEVDTDNGQAYVNGWIAKMENDPKLALSAATHAMKAVDFITEG